jgi:hypothetical protein
MKAISLSRPWPWAFLHLGKRLENQRRKDGRVPAICRHRGPLYLHAAKSWDCEAVQWMIDRGLCHAVASRTLPVCPPRNDHPAGGIFARCCAVAHLFALPDGRAADVFDEPYDALDMRWWMGGHALVLVDLEPTPFVECRGHLGLWNVPPHVLERLEGGTG